jgi:glutamate 5-kinase
LIILTTVDGVLENFGKSNQRTISTIKRVDDAVEDMAGGTDSATAVGGMASKVQAAKIVIRSGVPLVIASGRKKQVIAKILGGEDEGTLFVPQTTRLKGRKRWIAFFHHPKGTLVVDAGARKALRDGGKSLLPPGIARCEGNFDAGEVVRICDLDGTEIARGISDFGSDEIKGKKLQRVEVVHRDNLVTL